MPHKVTLEALEVLDAIDRKGSFSAAAGALYRVPSALTYSVRKLEEDLGVTLFRKQGRRSVLTPAGRVLLEQGRELLDAAERLVENTRQVDRGWESVLSIAVDSILTFDYIYPYLAEFFVIKSDIEIDLSEEVLGGAWESIHDARVDLVVGAPDKPSNTSGLQVVEMMKIDWAFCVSRDHPLTSMKRPLVADDLKPYPAVVVRDTSRHLPPQSRRIFDLQTPLRVTTIEQKIAAQIRGLGVGFLPCRCVQDYLDSGELIELETEQKPDPMPLHLVWRTGHKGRALNWFVERLTSDLST